MRVSRRIAPPRDGHDVVPGRQRALAYLAPDEPRPSEHEDLALRPRAARLVPHRVVYHQSQLTWRPHRTLRDALGERGTRDARIRERRDGHGRCCLRERERAGVRSRRRRRETARHTGAGAGNCEPEQNSRRSWIVETRAPFQILRHNRRREPPDSGMASSWALKRELHALKGEQHDLHQRKSANRHPGARTATGDRAAGGFRSNQITKIATTAARASANGPPSTATAT